MVEGYLEVEGWGIDIGDEAAFEQFVRARGQAHARTAALLLGDHQLGEDLVQEVLARMAVRWRAVSQVADLDAYVTVLWSTPPCRGAAAFLGTNDPTTSSLGTVKSQNAKALARLRVLLTEDLETT